MRCTKMECRGLGVMVVLHFTVVVVCNTTQWREVGMIVALHFTVQWSDCSGGGSADRGCELLPYTPPRPNFSTSKLATDPADVEVTKYGVILKSLFLLLIWSAISKLDIFLATYPSALLKKRKDKNESRDAITIIVLPPYLSQPYLFVASYMVREALKWPNLWYKHVNPKLHRKFRTMDPHLSIV